MILFKVAYVLDCQTTTIKSVGTRNGKRYTYEGNDWEKEISFKAVPKNSQRWS